VSDVGAIIGHPAYWRKLRKLKTGLTSDQTTLVPPPDVAKLERLSTTAAPLAGGTTAKAILGNWSDCIIGVRKDITVRVLSEALMGSNLQVGIVAYARVDIAAARPASFCTMEGITVS
jgi:HK97 family phage major capsid protein